jgi:hypothetical protein
MGVEEKESLQNVAKLPDRKRRSIGRRILRVLLILFVVVVIGLSIVLYNPVRTVASLTRVDDYPLFVMKYKGTYLFDLFAKKGTQWGVYRKLYETLNPAACTSFAALSPQGERMFGRNLDWQHRSSLLLYTAPRGGYASVSMVDLFYLGLEGKQEIGWPECFVLLGAPYATIDGMNECGVAIAQNAIPHCEPLYDPQRPTLLCSQILRLVLDHAKDVEQALELISKYNVEFPNPGVIVHFHVADASGKSAIVEYVGGEMVVTRNEGPWQVSTNFLLCEERPQGANSSCWRYNKVYQELARAQGSVTPDQAMALLETAKLDFTVWSVVYSLTTGRIQVALGRDYKDIHTFELPMKARR